MESHVALFTVKAEIRLLTPTLSSFGEEREKIVMWDDFPA